MASLKELAVSKMNKPQLLVEAAKVPGEAVSSDWSCDELRSVIKEFRAQNGDGGDSIMKGMNKLRVDALKQVLTQEGVTFDSKDNKGKLLRLLRSSRESAAKAKVKREEDKTKVEVSSSTMEAQSVLKREAGR